MSLGEWFVKNGVEALKVAVPAVVSFFAAIKVAFSKSYNDQSKIREKQLEVYGHIRLLCLKFSFEKTDKEKIVEELEKSLDENYVYIEDSIILEIKKVISSEKRKEELKKDMDILKREIDRFYVKLRRKRHYEIKTYESTDQFFIICLVYMMSVAIIYVLMGFLGVSYTYRQNMFLICYALLIVIMFGVLVIFLGNVIVTICKAIWRFRKTKRIKKTKKGK